jgi:hypothetical protein
MQPWRPPWPGFTARGSLLLPLPAAAELAKAPLLELGELSLARKSEFHVTLLDRALGARVHAPKPGGAPAQNLAALFAGLDWGWRLGSGRWLLLEARPGGINHSVVQLLEMPALAAFRAGVGELLGERLPEAPAHVTLYVAGDPIGIGIASTADFERLRLRRLP